MLSVQSVLMSSAHHMTDMMMCRKEHCIVLKQGDVACDKDQGYSLF